MRRLAWPLHEDDTHKLRSGPQFSAAVYVQLRITLCGAPKKPAKPKNVFLGSINRCSWCRVAQGPLLASYVPPLPNANLASTSVLRTTPNVMTSEDMSKLFGFTNLGKALNPL